MPFILELDAIHYKDHSKSQYFQANTLLNEIKIEESFSILDVGCGHGEIIAELSTFAPKGRCVGVDPSVNMIQLASNTFPESLYNNLEFYQLKAEEMHFHDQAFDLIVCTNAFMWVKEPKKALDLMVRFLKKGGHLIIFTYGKDTPYVNLFENVLHKHYPQLVDESAVNTMLSIEEHKELLLEHKMNLEVFSSEEIVFSYKNKEEFKNYILGWLACYAPIPREQQEDFIEKVIEQAEKFNLSGLDGKFSIPHTTLSIKASKT